MSAVWARRHAGLTLLAMTEACVHGPDSHHKCGPQREPRTAVESLCLYCLSKQQRIPKGAEPCQVVNSSVKVGDPEVHVCVFEFTTDTAPIGDLPSAPNGTVSYIGISSPHTRLPFGTIAWTSIVDFTTDMAPVGNRVIHPYILITHTAPIGSRTTHTESIQ
ncbi:hypothetical protein BDR03DRAFT_987780 [Suillus americanus]|nr:hypothetical protein BDR03DRAFT_987780 [Suillus americanus]